MRFPHYRSWMLGTAVLAAVVVAALHFSEEREFTRLVEESKPGWLAVALALQAATYVAQAEVFRAPLVSGGAAVPAGWLYELSLTKLFVDQALPSGGLSSTVVVVKALQDRGVRRDTAAACAMVNIASYHAAYVASLSVALVIISALHEINAWLLVVSLLFIAFALALAAAVTLLAGRRTGGGRWTRLPVVKGAIHIIDDANASLVRSPSVFGTAVAWQIAIFLLDAATVWVAIRALGADAAPAAVFASFMISSLVRTMGVVPGGLGTYEAMSVLTLRVVGLSFSVALSATLIFRGLSFWIPMLPGLWSSRRIMKSREARSET